MPFIQNVSMLDIKNGNHKVGGNMLLIQVVDPAYGFPEPKHTFNYVEQFEFLDSDSEDYAEFLITDKQAKRIIKVLQFALENDINVVVHCHAGLCRSGAICEVGTIMGFEDTHRTRIPNVYVKTKLLKALGLGY